MEKPLSNRARKRQVALLRRTEREARATSEVAVGVDADGNDAEDAKETSAPKRHKADAVDGMPTKAKEPKQKAKLPEGSTSNGALAKKNSSKTAATEIKDLRQPAADAKKESAKPAGDGKKELAKPAMNVKKDSAKLAADAPKGSTKPQAPGKLVDTPKKDPPTPAPLPVKKLDFKPTEVSSKKDVAKPTPAAPKLAAPKAAATSAPKSAMEPPKPVATGKTAEPAKASASHAGKAAAALPTKVVALDAKRKQLLQQVRGQSRVKPTAA